MLNAEQTSRFLSLVRAGIGHDVLSLLGSIDWKVQEALAEQQGLLAILMDAVEQLPDDQRPPQILLLQWIGQTFEGFENRYEPYCRTIAEMASWYNRHGYKMMLLKGLSCGLDWPNPQHRPYGDIDIWLFGKQKEADEILAREHNVKIDNSHHHHSVFVLNGFTVENHYDFINVHHHKSNVEFEAILKGLAEEDTNFVMINGQKVYLPSPNLNALFLLKHMICHFTSTQLNLRQILDWAFFAQHYGKEVDWAWLEKTLQEYHMRDFFNSINAICINELGFDLQLFPTVQFNPFLTDRILNDTISPEFNGKEPRFMISRLLFKYHRWKANEWKHEICYNESMRSAFWSGIKNHLLKPASI